MTTSNELPRECGVEEGQEGDVASLGARKLGPQQPLDVISYNMETMDLGWWQTKPGLLAHSWDGLVACLQFLRTSSSSDPPGAECSLLPISLLTSYPPSRPFLPDYST